MSSETLRPNAAGNSDTCIKNGCTSNWECVDEAVSDGDTTYCKCEFNGNDLHNIDNSALGAGTIINAVTLHAVIKRFSPLFYHGYIGIKSGSTESWSDLITLPESWTEETKEYTTDPNTGLAWTVAAINALQIGYKSGPSTDTSAICCTQVYVVVDYVVVSQYTKIFTADAILKQTSTKTFVSDVLLCTTETKTFTADSIIVNRKAKEFIADTITVNRYAKTFACDSILVNQATKTFVTDAVLSGKISGITRDSSGNPLGSCIVWVFKSADKSYVAETTSDAVSGEYTFDGLLSGTDYFIRAFKDDSPNVFGTTDDNLQAS